MEPNPRFASGFQATKTAASLNLTETEVSQAVSDVMRRVYTWMTAGLLLTAMIAYYVSGSETLMSIIFGNQVIFYGLFVVQIALVFAASAGAYRWNPNVALGIFFLYAALNGVLFGFIPIVYDVSTIALAFLSTAGMFGAMAVVGMTTKTDLTQYRSFFFMGLIGLIGATILNMFLANDALSWILTYAGLALFLGLTAYVMQRVRNTTMGALASGNLEAMAPRIAVSGALSLYINFINIFLRMLRILNRR